MTITEEDVCPLSGSKAEYNSWRRQDMASPLILIPFRALGNITDAEAVHEAAMERAYKWDRDPSGNVRLWGEM